MIDRKNYLENIDRALKRSWITSLVGPRQCGKTTLARIIEKKYKAFFFDLESPKDQVRLQNPQMALEALQGLVIIDEIQIKPELFSILRVIADRPGNNTRFLILGSASPGIIKGISETLAGRAEIIEMSGFNLMETGPDSITGLWLKGGFPRSYLSGSLEDSLAWREGFIRTFLERDIPQLGITIPSPAMRRFWTMLAHSHGQVLNSSELGRSLGVTDKTVRSYLDILTGTYMIRQVQPWFENMKKRQVKAPKIYFRDSGILHHLMSITGQDSLMVHPRLGASWEGFALEQAVQILGLTDCYFWSTYSGAELDLLFFRNGKRYGMEFKFTESPRPTRSMHSALKDLGLDHLWIIYPGLDVISVDERISVHPLAKIHEIY